MRNTHVTYTIEIDAQLVVVENVPARVNDETGEQLFSPDTVEHLQRMIWEKRKPKQLLDMQGGDGSWGGCGGK